MLAATKHRKSQALFLPPRGEAATEPANTGEDILVRLRVSEGASGVLSLPLSCGIMGKDSRC